MSYSKKAHFHKEGSAPPLKKLCGARTLDGTTSHMFYESSGGKHNGKPLEDFFCKTCLRIARGLLYTEWLKRTLSGQR